MSLENVHYDAFISYRHSEHDMFVATNLQQKLEAFKLPKPLAANANGKTRIERVFRDQDELPLASNLSDPIEEALKNSDFLIVICSPRLPESMWCKKEIETFAALHGRDRILAVLCEGEPAESFPPFLQSETVETVNEQGEKILVTRAIEPLAAEARAKTQKETKKLLDDAVLRIAAPIFNLNYDDLKQRHKEQRFKKLAAIWGSISAAVLIFALVCIIMLFRISAQNKTIEQRNAEIETQNAEITKQNEEITLKSQEILKQNEEISNKNNEISKQNDEITRQRDEIAAQYIAAAKNYAVSMVSVSDRLISGGRRIDAIAALRNAMPASIDGDELPYSAEAHSALANLTEAYNDGSTFIPSRVIETPFTISSYSVSPSGKTVAIYDIEFGVQVFDTTTGKLIYENTNASGNYSYSATLVNDKSLILDNNGLCKTDLETGEESSYTDNYDCFSSIFSVWDCISMPNCGRYIITDNKNILVFDAEDDSLKAQLNLNADFENSTRSLNSVGITDDGKYLYALVLTNYSDSQELSIYDLTDGSLCNSTPLDIPLSASIASDGKRVFVSYPYTDPNVKYLFSDAKIEAYSIKTGKLLWENTYKQYGIDYIGEITYCSDGDYLLGCSSSNFESIDVKTGELIEHISLDSMKMNYSIRNNGRLVLIFCFDESVLLWSPLTNRYYEYTDTLYKFAPKETMLSCGMYGSTIIVCPSNENYLAIYEQSKVEQFPLLGNARSSDMLSSNGKYAVHQAGDGYSVYSTENGQDLFAIGETGYLAHFTDDGKYLVNTEDDVVNIFDIAEAKLSHSIYLPDLTSINAETCMSPAGKYVEITERGSDYSIIGKDIFLTESGDFVTSAPANKDTILTFADGRNIYASTYSAAANSNTSSVKLYNFGADEPYAEKELDIRFLSDMFFTDDAKYLFAEYNNSTIEIYDTDSLQLVNTHYGISKKPMSANYIKEHDIYGLFFGDEMYLLNSSMEVISKITGAHKYDAEHDAFVIFVDDEISYAPYMSYEDIIAKADAMLDGYEIPARIKAENGIK